MRSSKYTREVLEPVVARACSLSDVIRAFGLKPTGGNHRHFTAVIFKAGLDTDHFGPHGLRRIRSLSREELQPIVSVVTSMAQVLARLDLPTVGRPHYELGQRIRALEIDVAHFRGRGWSRGETKRTHASVAHVANTHTFSDAQVFVEGSLITGKGLTPRLLKLGWKYTCTVCGIAEWQGRALTLQLDHINGKHYDNRLENLRFMCPNCHAQTPTYGNRAREACYTLASSRAWWNGRHTTFRS